MVSPFTQIFLRPRAHFFLRPKALMLIKKNKKRARFAAASAFKSSHTHL
jgi:hypothetical protein